MTDQAKTITILRAVADLLEANPDLNAPYLSFHFNLRAGEGCDPPAMAALIAEAFPAMPWTMRTSSDSSGKETGWLESRHHHPLSVAIAAPAEAFGTQAGQRVVTEWEPVAAIAAILADRKDDDGS